MSGLPNTTRAAMTGYSPGNPLWLPDGTLLLAMNSNTIQSLVTVGETTYDQNTPPRSQDWVLRREPNGTWAQPVLLSKGASASDVLTHTSQMFYVGVSRCRCFCVRFASRSLTSLVHRAAAPCCSAPATARSSRRSAPTRSC